MKNKKEKDTAMSIADTLAREGCAIIPGGGIAYDSVKALVNYGKRYYEERNEKRLERFHENLLKEGSGAQESTDNLKVEFSEDDYYSLLKSMLQDEEDDKVDYYSSLMKSIISGSVSSAHKKYFIRSLKELSVDELQLMRQFYILSNFEMKDDGSIKQQLKSIVEQPSPMVKALIHNLIRLGFVEINQDLHLPTSLLEEFVPLIIVADQLTPQSIGKECYHEIDVFVATFVDEKSLAEVRFPSVGPYERSEDEIEKYSSSLALLKSILDQTKQSYIIANPERFTEVQKSAKLIILCLDRFENPMLYYSWNKELLEKEKVFKVILDVLRTTGKPYDTLPGTEASQVFDFTKLDVNLSETLKNEIKDHFDRLQA